MKWFAAVSLVVLLAGCQNRTAVARVSIPNLQGTETPLPGTIVTFLPYDRDSILAQLEAAAPPRPYVRELDSLFRAFRKPFQAFLVLSDSVDRADRTGAEFGKLEQRMVTSRSVLDTARNTLWPKILEYRQAVAAWEERTYQGYRRETRLQPDRMFATPVADTTDAQGWVQALITDGTWWATARSIDPGDPNREWYWNVRVDLDTVHLDPRTGRHRPRY